MPPDSPRAAPLAGIRVVDLSRVFAMPYVGAYLADLGAEVIKIDTHHAAFVDTTRTITGPYPDNSPGAEYWNQAGTFQTLNRGKRSLTLDLRSPEAMESLLELVSVSDVVLENFTPRVIRTLGLGYSRLRVVRPDLVLVSNTGYGHSGPWSDFGAMASALEPTHGSGAYMGYLEAGPDGRSAASNVPNKVGNSYTDFLACWSAQLAILSALYRRALTGDGVWVDLAMYQNGVSFFGEGLLDYAYNGRRTRRMGNRHPVHAPHGVFPCRGNDRWLALSVREEGQWRALCDVIGNRDLTDCPMFGEALNRKQNEDELEGIISDWTRTRTQDEAAMALLSAGVPAAPVMDGQQMLSDPHLRQRGFFERVVHSPSVGLGAREYIGRGWKLANSDVQIRGPAPDLGEANDYVLGEILGQAPAQIAKLRADGAIGESLEGGTAPGAVPLDRQAELGWIVRHVGGDHQPAEG